MNNAKWSKLLLGEDLENITIAILEKVFKNGIQESDIIECKTGRRDKPSKEDYSNFKKTIIENVCAFSNSGGGLLLIGVPEDVNDGVITGNIEPLYLRCSKDTIVNIITTGLIPVYQNYKVNILTNRPGFVYLIECGESLTVPHQTSDNKFYMRLDGQKKIAPYHYVEALFKQVKYPIVIPALNIWNGKITGNRTVLRGNLKVCNLSRFINDRHPYLILSSAYGYFMSDPESYLPNRHLSFIDGKIIYASDKVFSTSLSINFDFLFIPSLSFENHADNSIHISVLYYGELSPSVVSEYSFTLTINEHNVVMPLNFKGTEGSLYDKQDFETWIGRSFFPPKS